MQLPTMVKRHANYAFFFPLPIMPCSSAQYIPIPIKLHTIHPYGKVHKHVRRYRLKVALMCTYYFTQIGQAYKLTDVCNNVNVQVHHLWEKWAVFSFELAASNQQLLEGLWCISSCIGWLWFQKTLTNHK